MLGKVSIAVKTFGVCDFCRLAVTDWRLRRWRLWFLAPVTATPPKHPLNHFILEMRGAILCCNILQKWIEAFLTGDSAGLLNWYRYPAWETWQEALIPFRMENVIFDERAILSAGILGCTGRRSLRHLSVKMSTRKFHRKMFGFERILS